MKKHQERHKSDSFVAFTLVELLTVVAIIALLSSLVFARLARARESALSAACVGNLRQIGIALRLYIDQCDAYPLATLYESGNVQWNTWRELLLPYVPKVWNGSFSGDLFLCPKSARRNDGLVRMALNAFGTDVSYDSSGFSQSSLGLGHAGSLRNNIPVRDSRVLAPADMIAVLNLNIYAGYIGFGWPGGMASDWHQGGALALFCDSHVESRKSRSSIQNQPSLTTHTLIRFSRRMPHQPGAGTMITCRIQKPGLPTKVL